MPHHAAEVYDAQLWVLLPLGELHEDAEEIRDLKKHGERASDQNTGKHTSSKKKLPGSWGRDTLRYTNTSSQICGAKSLNLLLQQLRP